MLSFHGIYCQGKVCEKTDRKIKIILLYDRVLRQNFIWKFFPASRPLLPTAYGKKQKKYKLITDLDTSGKLSFACLSFCSSSESCFSACLCISSSFVNFVLSLDWKREISIMVNGIGNGIAKKQNHDSKSTAIKILIIMLLFTRVRIFSFLKVPLNARCQQDDIAALKSLTS